MVTNDTSYKKNIPDSSKLIQELEKVVYSGYVSRRSC